MLNINKLGDFFYGERIEVIMQHEIITSIDFGSKKFSASVAVSNKDGDMDILGVKSCKSEGIEKGLVTDVEKCKASVLGLLDELQKTTQKNIRDITIGISARNVKIKEIRTVVNVDGGVISSRNIRSCITKAGRELLINNDEQLIDLMINFCILDGKVIHDNVIGMKANKLEINYTAAIGLKEDVQKYYDIFEGSKYTIKYIMLNIYSGKQIFLNEKNSIGDIALVDIGAGETDICLFNNGIPKFIQSIPLGGNNISNDLAICGKFSFMEADNIKVIYSGNYESLYKDESLEDDIEVGTTSVSKELFYEVTNARIEEILTHINMELKKTGHYDRICSIILYGDGLSYFENINEYIKNIISIKSRFVNKTDLGIKNAENITSLALAKDVYDRLKLIGDNDTTQIVEEIHTKKNEAEFLLNEEKEKSPILGRIKTLLGKIF